MARKFNSHNTNKLLTRIVLLVTFLSLAYFAYLFIRDAEVNRTYLESIGTCGSGEEWCYAIWHKYLDDFRSAQQWSAVIGFGLPILFFGGKALINYIAPEHKDK
jgi:hypothetical protein